jgi:hypothetical protein
VTTADRWPATTTSAGPAGLAALGTETANPSTDGLDAMTTLEVLRAINAEDRTVAAAVERVLPAVARAVDLVVAARGRGGRLIYVGAGTSGRLGLLDAVECPPTFGTAPEEVVGVLAGGDGAFAVAAEGAEDDEDLAVADLDALAVGPMTSSSGWPRAVAPPTSSPPCSTRPEKAAAPSRSPATPAPPSACWRTWPSRWRPAPRSSRARRGSRPARPRRWSATC